MTRFHRTGFAGMIALLAALLFGAGQTRAAAAASAPSDSAHPVTLAGDTLFAVRAASGDFSGRERAAAVSARLQDLTTVIAAEASQVPFAPESLRVERAADDSGARVLRYGAKGTCEASAAMTVVRS